MMRASLGSVNHQARPANEMRSVGTSDGQEIHDIAQWSGGAGGGGRAQSRAKAVW